MCVITRISPGSRMQCRSLLSPGAIFPADAGVCTHRLSIWGRCPSGDVKAEAVRGAMLRQLSHHAASISRKSMPHPPGHSQSIEEEEVLLTGPPSPLLAGRKALSEEQYPEEHFEKSTGHDTQHEESIALLPAEGTERRKISYSQNPPSIFNLRVTLGLVGSILFGFVVLGAAWWWSNPSPVRESETVAEAKAGTSLSN